MKKDTVTGIIGAISGLAVAKAARDFFKSQGKVGPVGTIGQIITELATGVIAAGASTYFADRCVSIGKDAIDKLNSEDMARTDYRSFYKSPNFNSRDEVELPERSRFITEDEYHSLLWSKGCICNLRTLRYYAKDEVLTDDDADAIYDPELVEKIKAKIDLDTDGIDFYERLLYFDRYDEPIGDAVGVAYEIFIWDDCYETPIKEEDNGGEA